MNEALIPIVVMTGMFAMIFGIVYIKSRENMAMIEKGWNPKQKYSRPRPFINLKYGLLMIGAGLGLLVAYLIDLLAVHHHGAITITTGAAASDVNANVSALYIALIAIGGGIGLFLSYRIEKKEWLDKNTEE